jgi:hypothetical protein
MIRKNRDFLSKYSREPWWWVGVSSQFFPYLKFSRKLPDLASTVISIFAQRARPRVAFLPLVGQRSGARPLSVGGLIAFCLPPPDSQVFLPPFPFAFRVKYGISSYYIALLHYCAVYKHTGLCLFESARRAGSG